MTTRWHARASREAFEAEARRRILSAAQEALTARGVFRIVLAGGETPRGVYARLRAADTDWADWHVYIDDERCLTAGHPERNDTMARQAWLAHAPLAPERCHAIPAELGAEDGAERYAEALKGLGTSDLVVLGLGQDGHTASLFSGQAWRQATAWPDAFAVHDAPKPPPDRVTLSPARLPVPGGGRRQDRCHGRLARRRGHPGDVHRRRGGRRRHDPGRCNGYGHARTPPCPLKSTSSRA